MRYYYLYFLLFMFPLICYSADNIYLNSGEKFECKVISVDTSTVTVEILLTGIRRTFYKYEIKVIIYENGNAETFQIVKPESPSIKTEAPDESEKRLRELEKKSAKSDGVVIGVGACCVLLLILLII